MVACAVFCYIDAAFRLEKELSDLLISARQGSRTASKRGSMYNVRNTNLILHDLWAGSDKSIASTGHEHSGEDESARKPGRRAVIASL